MDLALDRAIASEKTRGRLDPRAVFGRDASRAAHTEDAFGPGARGSASMLPRVLIFDDLE